ncbi:hypothetical protein CF204P1_24970 [Citrobacter freundii]|uniref:Uncharacterized protein n=1 Tax=uncultured Citrobacter sp. TaxID=200446 RepID=A0A212IJD6_9ENTR|nr:hypothetical protein CF204P1_24970 [Citrobacter freundii]CAD5356352.1 conserved protein of unknown function [Citrobacter freundii]SBV66853.1 conserved hypothetical protein [uncultured Citrobacter sp.]SBV67184.1 conserved hypothetical protein [uncultured Citrobacter sp.]
MVNNELAALIIDKRFTEHHRCPSLLTETEVESSTVIVIKPDMYGLRNITPHLYLYLTGGQLLPLYLPGGLSILKPDFAVFVAQLAGNNIALRLNDRTDNKIDAAT